MSVFESIDRYSVEYLPSGDHAMLIAWTVLPTTVGDVTGTDPFAILCLEDGSARLASLDEFKFDFRHHDGRWVDVSGPLDEGNDADTDPEAGDDGGQEVPG